MIINVLKFGSLVISGTLDRYDPERGIIRDRKTSGRIDNIERDVENTFDYATQMAFYYTLAYVNDGKDCDVYLDILSKSAPYTSIVYRMTSDKLKRKMVDTIKPALLSLINCMETNTRPLCDRYDAMKSPYYPIMKSAQIVDVVDSN